MCLPGRQLYRESQTSKRMFPQKTICSSLPGGHGFGPGVPAATETPSYHQYSAANDTLCTRDSTPKPKHQNRPRHTHPPTPTPAPWCPRYYTPGKSPCWIRPSQQIVTGAPYYYDSKPGETFRSGGTRPKPGAGNAFRFLERYLCDRTEGPGIGFP